MNELNVDINEIRYVTLLIIRILSWSLSCVLSSTWLYRPTVHKAITLTLLFYYNYTLVPPTLWESQCLGAFILLYKCAPVRGT